MYHFFKGEILKVNATVQFTLRIYPFFQGITLDAVPTSQEKTLFHCSSNMVFICACGELAKQHKFNFALAKALAIKVFSIGDTKKYNPN